MSYEIIRAESLEKLQEAVKTAIFQRGCIPVGGMTVELMPFREKITETQVVHSFKSLYLQPVASINLMAMLADDMAQIIKRRNEERDAICNAGAPPPIPPRPRRRRKTKKR